MARDPGEPHAEAIARMTRGLDRVVERARESGLTQTEIATHLQDKLIEVLCD